jgi:hypothetical protein
VEGKSETSPDIRLNKKGGKITHFSNHIQIIFYVLKPPYLAFHWWREGWENRCKSRCQRLNKKGGKITHSSISLHYTDKKIKLS